MQDSQIIRTEYSDIMKKSYIDYAMSVIVARALPDVRDGLKPVREEHSTICMSLESVTINRIGNALVLSVIQWVSIIHTVIVPSMNHWL